MDDDTLSPEEAQQRRERDARARALGEQEDGDLREVMGTESGRRWVWRLLTRCGIYRLSYTPNDATATSFNEGGRNIGLAALADIMRVCPRQYGLMVAENQGGGE